MRAVCILKVNQHTRPSILLRWNKIAKYKSFSVREKNVERLVHLLRYRIDILTKSDEFDTTRLFLGQSGPEHLEDPYLLTLH